MRRLGKSGAESETMVLRGLIEGNLESDIDTENANILQATTAGTDKFLDHQGSFTSPENIPCPAKPKDQSSYATIQNEFHETSIGDLPLLEETSSIDFIVTT